jgi:Protein of unknown function (DUF2490)
MKAIFLATVLSAMLGSLFGQSSGLGSWNILNVKYNHTDNLSLFAEAQLRSLRFYDHFHYYELKGGINYNVLKNLKLTLGAGSYQTYKEGGDFVLPKNNDEFRLWPQAILSQEIGKFKIEQRYRLEMRWGSNGYRNRFRYRLGLSYPFGKGSKGYKPFLASLNNELFFTDKAPYFERNRIQTAFNYKPSHHTTIQLGYLHQFDYRINDETGRDFLVIGFYFEFSRKSATAAQDVNELRDN